MRKIEVPIDLNRLMCPIFCWDAQKLAPDPIGLSFDDSQACRIRLMKFNVRKGLITVHP